MVIYYSKKFVEKHFVIFEMFCFVTQNNCLKKIVFSKVHLRMELVKIFKNFNYKFSYRSMKLFFFFS